MKKEKKNILWDKGKKIHGKDPNLYRQDVYRNVLYKSSYGKNSEMGWVIDHIKPKSKDGSASTRNFQILSTKINRKKGNSLVKKSRHSKSNK